MLTLHPNPFWDITQVIHLKVCSNFKASFLIMWSILLNSSRSFKR